MQNEASRAFREDCRAYAGEWFERVRSMSEDGPGVTRLGYGDVELAVVNALEAEGRRLGLEVAYDKAGNCWMTLPGRDRTLPAFVSGSHADSVIWGGNYDGLAGILAPLSAVRWMVEQEVVPPRDFSVVVMRCEEQGCIGSTGWLGRVKPEDFERRFKPHDLGLKEDVARLDPAPLLDTDAPDDGAPVIGKAVKADLLRLRKDERPREPDLLLELARLRRDDLHLRRGDRADRPGKEHAQRDEHRRGKQSLDGPFLHMSKTSLRLL